MENNRLKDYILDNFTHKTNPKFIYINSEEIEATEKLFGIESFKLPNIIKDKFFIVTQLDETSWANRIIVTNPKGNIIFIDKLSRNSLTNLALNIATRDFKVKIDEKYKLPVFSNDEESVRNEKYQEEINEAIVIIIDEIFVNYKHAFI